jgi:hypothetical protein
MEFSYKKNDNRDLFKHFTNDRFLNLENPQNYIPLYNTFFNINETNYNNINLLNNSYLNSVNAKQSENIFSCTIKDEKGIIKEKNVFFKYSPLLDPTKYIIGKYDLTDKLLNLPNFNEYNSHPKTRDHNNSSYVDSFFTYLTSRLYHCYGFVHGVDFYGSYISHKLNFNFNIADDIDYLNDSDFFHKNRGILFNVDNNYACNIFDFNTRTNKQRLIFNNQNEADCETDIEISNIEELNILDNIFKTLPDDNTNSHDNNSHDNNSHDNNRQDQCNQSPHLVFNHEISKKSNCSSKCSSRSSITDDDDDIEDNSTNLHNKRDVSNISVKTNNSSDSSTTSSNSCTTASEDVIHASIPKFPVQVIAMENCFDTLDSLIVNEHLTCKEWESIIIQILMILSTYQKVFSLTHNDLHTNNIMYNTTDKQFLYYKINDKYYKVPTFGRIFKIIDFGRAIYKFKGKLVCSDSFHSKGDAATQYNFEPYFNKNKPRLEPNYSFDLCRLGCSVYDFISDELNKQKYSILHIIADWCKDDKGRNILYKTNGDERYPDFKLYKMIARTVHKHVPSNVLQNRLFDKYIISKKKLPRNIKIINIDNIPIQTN